ncbi:TetR/AcrR family transcriptional regulator [Streptomyces sviceus]|uniref:TetR/AcrR family transcriptional regulator n=1 Tax=Streptomyces sviceus TaxID=285530 RepID=UPI0036A5FC59
MPEERADPGQVRSREAMVTAATTLLTEGGLEAVTHQAVATRAGVGRATVYRHWADMLGLRLAALEAYMPPLSPAPEDGRAASGAEPRAELVHYLRQIGERLDDAQAGAVLAAVLGGAQYDDGMQHLRQTVLAQIVDSLRPAVTAAVARGAPARRRHGRDVRHDDRRAARLSAAPRGRPAGSRHGGRGGGCGAAGVGAVGRSDSGSTGTPGHGGALLRALVACGHRSSAPCTGAELLSVGGRIRCGPLSPVLPDIRG